VGIRGVRIQTIVRELHDEKIDVIEWNSNPAVFIAKAISPARVSGVYLDTEVKGNKTATVVVPEDQLSLAIGRQGQNARLAAKLTGWRIDIMSLTEATGKALLKLQGNPSYAEMVESEAENMLKIEDLLQKKAEGRPLPPEDYKFMTRFVDRIEKRGEVERKAEQDAEQARVAEIKTTIPKLAYEIPISDIELKRSVLEILRDAGIENLGDLIMQTRLDSDTILALNGIGPKTLEQIIDFVENIKLPEESEQPDETSIPAAEQAEVTGELSKVEVLETGLDKSVPIETKQDEHVGQVELEGAAAEISQSGVVEAEEKAQTEEVPLEELFKVDSKKFDFYPEGEPGADDEGSGLTPAKKKGKKSKRGFTVVEYDPDKDQTIVRRKRKRDDGWEEW
jgi:N utilization substance protein A